MGRAKGEASPKRDEAIKVLKHVIVADDAQERAGQIVDLLVAAMREDLIGPEIAAPTRPPPRPAPPPKEVVVSWCTACGKSDYAYDHTQDTSDVEEAACPHCETATMAVTRYVLAPRKGKSR